MKKLMLLTIFMLVPSANSMDSAVARQKRYVENLGAYMTEYTRYVQSLEQDPSMFGVCDAWHKVSGPGKTWDSKREQLVQERKEYQEKLKREQEVLLKEVGAQEQLWEQARLNRQRKCGCLRRIMQKFHNS